MPNDTAMTHLLDGFDVFEGIFLAKGVEIPELYELIGFLVEGCTVVIIVNAPGSTAITTVLAEIMRSAGMRGTMILAYHRGHGYCLTTMWSGGHLESGDDEASEFEWWSENFSAELDTWFTITCKDRDLSFDRKAKERKLFEDEKSGGPTMDQRIQAHFWS
jgi:hypothetical protein